MTTDTREARIRMYLIYHTIKPKRARMERRTKGHHRDGDGPRHHLNCHVLLHEVSGIRTVSPAACIPLLLVLLYVPLSLRMGIEVGDDDI